MLDVFSRSKIELQSLREQFLPRVIGHVDDALIAPIFLGQRGSPRACPLAAMRLEYRHGFFKIG